MNQAGRVLMLWLGLACVVTPGCRRTEPPAPPPPTVVVDTPSQREVTEYYEYTGNTEAVESVEVRARVPGTLESMHFEPSSQVQKGDLLFVIEPEPYQIAIEAAEASLAAAKARVEEQQSIFDKIKFARDQDAATEAEYIEAIAQLDERKAEVLGAEASLKDAKLNYSYSQVTSPLTGRVDRELVDVGNLVGMGDPTLLTTIVQMDPIYVYFDVSERIVLEYLARRESGKIDTERDLVEVARANDPEGEYPFSGKMDFVDNKVDPTTGTILVRGIIENPELKLVPGLFVKARMPFDKIADAVVIREDAIGTDLMGKYVLVVNKDGVVEKRNVELGPKASASERVVRKGLAADERYIVVGIQKVRAGQKVNAETAKETPDADSASQQAPTDEPTPDQG